MEWFKIFKGDIVVRGWQIQGKCVAFFHAESEREVREMCGDVEWKDNRVFVRNGETYHIVPCWKGAMKENEK